MVKPDVRNNHPNVKLLLRFILLVVFFLVGLWLVFDTEIHHLAATTYQNSVPKVQKFIKNKTSAILPAPSLPPLSEDAFINLINDIRQTNKLSTLKLGPQTCSILKYYQEHRDLNPKQISSLCPSCQKVQILSLYEPIATASAMEFFTTNSTASAAVMQKDFTHICAVRLDQEMLVTFVASSVMPTQPTVAHRTITEDELWKSLSEYRRSQGVSQLSLDEKLCVYARKRVDDHLKLLAAKIPKTDYPNPDKYPLDAHDGFEQDADTGYVFEVTGRSEVAENLAYWPNAEYATHVIEWGWDQSKEGHRETQLSTEYTAACLTGQQGFFVAIFAR